MDWNTYQQFWIEWQMRRRVHVLVWRAVVCGVYVVVSGIVFIRERDYCHDVGDIEMGMDCVCFLRF